MYSSTRLGAVAVWSAWSAAVLTSCGGTSKLPPSGTGGSNAAGTLAAVAGEGPVTDGGAGFTAGEGQGGAAAGATGGMSTAGEPTGGAGPEGCPPGARTCDGPHVRVCAADGQSTRIEATCGPSEVCVNEACATIACVPNDTFCAGNELRRCRENGVDSERLETCGNRQFCSEQAGVAACTDTACSPGARLCVDDVATTCSADGSGPKPGGKDCSAEQSTCEAGQCVPQTCKAGEKSCEHDDVYFCIGGSQTVLFSKCEADEVCDPELLTCRSRICEPGKLGCDADRVATCNALGTAYVQSNIDCAASNQLCIAGSCRAKICTPNATYCDGNNVRRCDDKGTSSLLQEACSSSYYCRAYSGNQAYCSYNTCTPNAPACQGNLLTQCNAEGSGYVAGGTDCGTGSVCDNGACKTKVCEGYGAFCKDGDIHQCSSNGLSSYLWTDCGPDARCLANGQNIRCVPYDCSPGSKACLKNVVGTCAEDGTSLSNVKEDCAATEKVCSSASACAPSAVDSLGVAEEIQSYPANQVFGDVVDVLSNRRLTELQAHLVLAGERDLRWVVFEETNGYYVAKYDKLVKDQTGTGYASSGALEYELKAGRRYLLAVTVEQGGAAPYYDQAPWSPTLSFGRLVGGFTTSYATTISSGYGNSDRLFAFKATTSLP